MMMFWEGSLILRSCEEDVSVILFQGHLWVTILSFEFLFVTCLLGHLRKVVVSVETPQVTGGGWDGLSVRMSQVILGKDGLDKMKCL